MRTNRRELLGRLGTVVATSFLAGCGVRTICGCAPPPERGDAMLWHALTGSEVETSVEIYNDENDVEIVAEGTGDLRNRVETVLASDDGPEMYRWAQDWAGDHYQRDFLYDASDDIDIDLEETFHPQAVEAITVGADDAIVGLPVAGETVSLLYNEELVDAPPETFAEMERIASDYHNPENDRYGLSHPMSAYFASAWLRAFGGYYFQVDENGETTTGVDLDETKEGMRFVRDKIWKYTPDDVEYDRQKKVFENGDAPFAINGPWEISTLQDAGVDVGVAPFPEIDGGSPTPYTGTSMWYFSARMEDDEDRRKDALGYAEWISQSEERQLAYADAHSVVPVLRSIDSDDLDDTVAGFRAAYDSGIAMPNHPKMGDVWTPVGDAINAVLLDGADIDSRFDRAAEEIRAEWDR